MLYVVEVDETLFKRARVLEEKFNTTLPLAGVVQNTMLIHTENLNESFNLVYAKMIDLQQLYLPSALSEIFVLQRDIQQHVLKCTLNVSEDTVRMLCGYAAEVSDEKYDFNDIMTEINKTRNYLRTQNKTI